LTTYEVVIGATGQTLHIPLVDGNGQVASPVGEVGVALQGTSLDLPGVTVNVVGTYDSVNKLADFQAAGAILAAAQLAPKKRARFTCRVLWSDDIGAIYTPELTVEFKRLPEAITADEDPMFSYLNREEIIQETLWGRTTRHFQFYGPLSGVSWQLLKRPNAGAWTDNVEPPIVRPLNLPGANRSWHILFETMPNDDAIGIGDLWHRLNYRCGAMVSPFAFAGGSATMQSGISIGVPMMSDFAVDLDPPWTNPPLKPYIRYGIRPSTGKYFIEIAKGDSVRSLFTAEIGDWNIADAPFLEIEWDPYNRRIRFFNMGGMVYQYDDLAGMPQFLLDGAPDGSYGTSFALFVESGSDAAAVIQGFYSSARAVIIHPDELRGGAEMWYPEASV
jgi:hypothetical protein